MRPTRPRMKLGMRSITRVDAAGAAGSFNAPLDLKFNSGPRRGAALHHLRPETICATWRPSSRSQ
jgi:hypothetical protein